MDKEDGEKVVSSESNAPLDMMAAVRRLSMGSKSHEPQSRPRRMSFSHVEQCGDGTYVWRDDEAEAIPTAEEQRAALVIQNACISHMDKKGSQHSFERKPSLTVLHPGGHVQEPNVLPCRHFEGEGELLTSAEEEHAAKTIQHLVRGKLKDVQ